MYPLFSLRPSYALPLPLLRIAPSSKDARIEMEETGPLPPTCILFVDRGFCFIWHFFATFFQVFFDCCRADVARIANETAGVVIELWTPTVPNGDCRVAFCTFL